MDLDKLQHDLEEQLDKEEEREKLYDEQAEELTTGLIYGKKVNDGYYMWALLIKDEVCYIAAARTILMFKKGYKPMTAKFKINREFPMRDNIKEVVKMMLKKQNGEFIEDVDEEDK